MYLSVSQFTIFTSSFFFLILLFIHKHESHLIMQFTHKKKKQKTCGKAGVKSYQAGGRRHDEDQTMLTHYSVNSISVSHKQLLPALFIHRISNLHSCTLFAFSVSRNVHVHSLNSPVTLWILPAKAAAATSLNTSSAKHQNSFKSRKTSLALKR